MNRREDLDRFYRIIDTLCEKCRGFRCLKDCTRRSGWPGRGVSHAISSHPLLIPAALGAVLQWKYEPTSLNGEPVSVELQVWVEFNPHKAE